MPEPYKTEDVQRAILPTKETDPPSRVPVRYMLVLWLGVLSAVAYLDRTNISIAGIQIAREFGIDKVRLGWVFSAFLIGYACLQIPAGVVAKRIGPRRILLFAGLAWAIFTSLTALVPPKIVGALWLLILVRFALGSCEATMYPAASQFVERWLLVRERGRANGIIFAGVGFGSGVTPPLVTFIVLHYGWRASFWFSAFLGTAAVLVWYIAARDTPEEHAWVGEAERALIEEGRRNSSDDRRTIPWIAMMRSREILALSFSYFAFGYVAYIFLGWMYIYMATVRGLDLKSSAIYAMFPFIAMTVGCLSGGVISDWIATLYGLRMGRCLLPCVAMVLTATLLLTGSRIADARVAALVLACGAGALYLSQSGFFAVAADIAGEHTSVVSAAMNMGGQIGGATTASMTPLIAAHFGWETSFVTAAVCALLGGIAWIVVDPNNRLTPAPGRD